jgi:hypothetical protein
MAGSEAESRVCGMAGSGSPAWKAADPDGDGHFRQATAAGAAGTPDVGLLVRRASRTMKATATAAHAPTATQSMNRPRGAGP